MKHWTFVSRDGVSGPMDAPPRSSRTLGTAGVTTTEFGALNAATEAMMATKMNTRTMATNYLWAVACTRGGRNMRNFLTMRE